MPTVVITSEVILDAQGPHLEMLRNAGIDVRYLLRRGLTGEAETIEAVRGAAATIAGSEPYTEGFGKLARTMRHLTLGRRRRPNRFERCHSAPGGFGDHTSR